MRDWDDVTELKVAAHSRPCLYLDTHVPVGSIARLKTNIQATTTAHVNATAPDGTTTSRKYGTASITLTDRATPKSSDSGQFLIANNSSVLSLVVAESSDNAKSSFSGRANGKY